MKTVALACALMLLAGPSAALAECRFVAVDDPKFSIVFEPGATPVVTDDGKTERFESFGTGTGQAAMVAYPPDGDPTGERAFALHDYDGKTFLVWGTDLLVEVCGRGSRGNGRPAAR